MEVEVPTSFCKKRKRARSARTCRAAASAASSSPSSYTIPSAVSIRSSASDLLLKGSVAVTRQAGKGLDVFGSVVLLDPVREEVGCAQRMYAGLGGVEVVGYGALIAHLLMLHKGGVQYAVIGGSVRPECGGALALLAAQQQTLLHDPLTGTIWVSLRCLAKELRRTSGSKDCHDCAVLPPLHSSFSHLMRAEPLAVAVGWS